MHLWPGIGPEAFKITKARRFEDGSWLLSATLYIKIVTTGVEVTHANDLIVGSLLTFIEQVLQVRFFLQPLRQIDPVRCKVIKRRAQHSLAAHIEVCWILESFKR